MSAENFYMYRLFDKSGTLLYIGVSLVPEKRAKYHIISRRWGREVDESRTVIVPVGPRNVAFKIEAATIRAELPKYNRDNNPARPTSGFASDERNTPIRTFRVPADIRAKAQAKAKVEGVTLTSVVVAALEDYTQDTPKDTA